MNIETQAALISLKSDETEYQVLLGCKSFKRLKREAKKRELIIPKDLTFEVSKINRLKVLQNIKLKKNLDETLNILLQSSNVLLFDLLEQGNGVYTWKSVNVNIKPKDQMDHEKIKQNFILKLLIYLVDFFKEQYKTKLDEVPYMNYIKKCPSNKEILSRIQIKKKVN